MWIIDKILSIFLNIFLFDWDKEIECLHLGMSLNVALEGSYRLVSICRSITKNITYC